MELGENVAGGEKREARHGHEAADALGAAGIGATGGRESPGEREEGKEQGEARKVRIAGFPPGGGKRVICRAHVHQAEPVVVEGLVRLKHLPERGRAEKNREETAGGGAEKPVEKGEFGEIREKGGDKHQENVGAGERMKVEKNAGKNEGAEDVPAIGEGKSGKSEGKGHVGVGEAGGIKRVAGQGTGMAGQKQRDGGEGGCMAAENTAAKKIDRCEREERRQYMQREIQ